jgi:hypothetical protein
VAYNSADHQYLAVWTEEILFGGSVVTSVKGQRVAENGSMLGDPFTIAPFVAYPTIAYNAHVNEYVVAGINYGNIVGQRVSSSGSLVGSQATLMPGALKARIVCNSITGAYLVVGAVQPSSPPVANLQFYSSRVSADLQTVSAPELLVSWVLGDRAQTQVSAASRRRWVLQSQMRPTSQWHLPRSGHRGFLSCLLNQNKVAIPVRIRYLARGWNCGKGHP